MHERDAAHDGAQHDQYQAYLETHDANPGSARRRRGSVSHVLDAIACEARVHAEQAHQRGEAAPEHHLRQVRLDDRAEHDELPHEEVDEPLPEALRTRERGNNEGARGQVSGRSAHVVRVARKVRAPATR